MFCQLGDIVFDPLSGFDGYREEDVAVIVQYEPMTGKPLPVFTGPGLMELNIEISLRQEFIDVKQARLQLRAHKDAGDVLTLTWGTGEVAGVFLIGHLGMNAEYMDPLGNMIGCNMTVDLLEVPDGFLLASKQGSSYKQAFAADPKLYPAVVFKAPRPYKPKPWELWVGYVSDAIRFAGMIRALSYGGKFPNLGRSLGQIIGNADANMHLMQLNFGAYGVDYDIEDMTSPLSDVRTALGVLQGLDPVTQAVSFQSANRMFQSANNVVCF